MPRPRSRSSDDLVFLVTKTELAQLLGVSPRTVTRLEDAGLVADTPGRWALSSVLRYLYGEPSRPELEADELQDLDDDQAPDPAGQVELFERPADSLPDLTTAKRDLAVAQRRKLDVDTARAQGELLPVDEATHAFMGLAGVMTDSLDGFAPRLAGVTAPLSDPAECEHAIEQECHQLRRDLARAVREFEADYSPGGAAAGAPTRRRRRRVG